MFRSLRAPPGRDIKAKMLVFGVNRTRTVSTKSLLWLDHARTQSKHKPVMALLGRVEASGLAASNPDSLMYQVLQNLPALENKSSCAEGS